MKKSVRKWIIIAIVIIVLVIAAAYFLFFRGGEFSFGFTPDYSAGAGVGEAVGEVTNSNPYENVKLNPFENKS